MAKRLVLSFIATDEPGQVERITEAVAKSGGNWLDSRMAHLAEKFAGVARISVPDDKAAALEGALAALRDDGFHLIVETSGKTQPADGQVLVLSHLGISLFDAFVHPSLEVVADDGVHDIGQVFTWQFFNFLPWLWQGHEGITIVGIPGIFQDVINGQACSG